MKFRPITWALLSVALFAASFFFWQLAKKSRAAAALASAVEQAAPEKASDAPKTSSSSVSVSAPMLFPAGLVTTAPSTAVKEDFTFLLSNTPQNPTALTRNNGAILLRNAWIDTAATQAIAIPEKLRALTDPGSYIVKFCGTIHEGNRAALKAAQAEIISYVPNNAFLVRVSGAGAKQLASASCAVLPYEPYYKLEMPLLENAVKGQPLSAGQKVRLTLFPGQTVAAQKTVADIGARVVAEEVSPFGPELIVEVRQHSAEALVAFAQSTAVQNIEAVYERKPANDLMRVRLGIAPDTTNDLTLNHLGLTGLDAWVNINDTGVDTNHPDLKPRVFPGYQGGVFPNGYISDTTDVNGHGTFMAGVIASSGENDLGITPSGSNTNGLADFRGMAPKANLLALNYRGPGISDARLMETAARTNYVLLQRTNVVMISNNSWNYEEARRYNSAAATYDAIVRDAIPTMMGMQPMLLVFSAGNSGGGGNNGTGGDRASIASPATAKNVITVGGIEQPRFITNEVRMTNVFNGTNVVVTNQPWLGMTDSSNQVAWFSSRGNVDLNGGVGTTSPETNYHSGIGYNLEGEFGRFKPDVVAPSTFAVSTRSENWDTNAYYNPTNIDTTYLTNIVLSRNETNQFAVFVPRNCVGIELYILPNLNSPVPMQPINIYTNLAFDPVPSADPANFAATNVFRWGKSDGSFVTNVSLFFDLVNTNTNTVDFDLSINVLTTNNVGDYFKVLADLNDTLSPNYRYESGTSVAAAGVSGMLALFQEYFAKQTSGLTNPTAALLKAMLINSARDAGQQYDLNMGADINYQGWGVPDIRRALPATNFSIGSMLVFDEHATTNCVGTDEKITRTIAISSNANTAPLRVTLVWTDPPGNPAVGVKLVNDLDLIVTNLDTGDIYYGNSFYGGNFSQVSGSVDPTNGAVTYFPDRPADVVNNVENVYLNGPLGTNYAVTVLGRRVHVNAVTGQTNGIKQDFALVIASGNLAVTNALVVANAAAPLLTAVPKVVMLTNGVPLFGQRIGANSPLTWDPATALTNGNTNQWNFYVLENTNASFTNVAFLTFAPPNLSGTAKSGRPVPTLRNVEADIDIYVSTDPKLLDLDTATVAAATKATGRGGTELIVLNNGAVGKYYVGIKSEDQRAAEYGFFSIATDQPFATDGTNGTSVRFHPMPGPIPDGTPDKPGSVLLFGINDRVPPQAVRRVLVQPMIEHELYGDLVVSLSDAQGQRTVVLNNHSFPGGQESGTFANWYNDLDEGDLANMQATDGPGLLTDFIGENPSAWILTVQDNADTHVGYVSNVTLVAEPQPTSDDSFGGGFIARCISPDRSFLDFIEVPSYATSLIVEVVGENAGDRLEVYVRRERLPIPPVGGNGSDASATLTLSPATTNALTHTIDDVPPLQGGRYFVRFFNNSNLNGNRQICFHYRIRLELDLNPALTTSLTMSNPVPIIDDAVTRSALFVANQNSRVVDVNVGVRIDHPRVSDLSLHLVSPDGTRVLLFENRGGLTPDGLGANVTAPVMNKVTLLSSGFETPAVAGDYLEPQIVDGWNVLSGQTANTNSGAVTVINDITMANTGSQFLKLRQAGLTRTLPTATSNAYTLRYAYRRDEALNPAYWWKGDGDALDAMGLAPGTLVNGTTATNVGEVGQAFTMDGTNDYVSFGSTAGNFGTNNFTVDFWIKTTTTRMEAVIAKRAVCNGTSGWGIRIGGTGFTGRPNVYLCQSPAGANCNGLIATRPVNDGQWHHVAMVRQGITASFYLDGVFDSSASSTGIVGNGVTDLVNGADLTTGTEVCVPSDGTQPFTGNMDEIAIYHQALSASQILELYRAGNAGKCGTTTPPTNCGPATAQVTLDGIVTNLVAGTNWLTNATAFTATTADAPLLFEGAGRTNLLLLTNSFEGALTTNYGLGTNVAGWTVTSSNVATVQEPLFTEIGAGTNVLSINCVPNSTNAFQGSATRTLLTAPGGTYTASFIYRRAHSSLVNWWPGDGAIADIIGGQDGNLNGGMGYASGLVGQAFDFDGVDDSVACGTNAGNFGTNDFTIDFWIKTTNATVPNYLIGKRAGCGCSSFWNIVMGHTGIADGKILLEMSNDNSCSIYESFFASKPVNDGIYHHVAISRKGTLASIYIDGVLDISQIAPGVLNLNNSGVLEFGTSLCIPAGPTTRFQGVLDEIGIHNRAISAHEIRSIYLSRGAGRFDSSHPPTNSPPPAVTVDLGGATHTIFGSQDTNWTVFTTNFVASSSLTPISLTGRTNGLWLDSWQISGPPPGPSVWLDSIVLEGEEVQGNFVYATFTENTNLFPELMKFAKPPYATNPPMALTAIATNSFETEPDTANYAVSSPVEGWTVTRSNVSVWTEPFYADAGTNVLALNCIPGTTNGVVGRISTNMNLTVGSTYEFKLNARRAHSSLVNWWPGDSNTLDVIGGQDGFLNGTTNYGVGEVQESFTFDGVDDYVNFGMDAGNFGTNDFTIDFWVQANAANNYSYLLGKRTACGCNSFWNLNFGHDLISDGTVQVEMSSDNSCSQSNSFFSTRSVGDGNYHHVAVVRKGVLVSLYIDGIWDAAQSTPGVINFNNAAQMRAGHGPCVPSNSRTYFRGQLDEIGIHNRAISSNEIRSIFLAGSAGRFDSSHPPTNSPPPSAQVVVAGVTNVMTGGAAWTNFTTRFTATNAVTPLAIEGLTNGLWLDSFQLVEIVGNQYYLAEESLDLFKGERALGNWILEVWDARAGAFLNSSLLSWQLNFTFSAIINAIKPLDFGDLNDASIGSATGEYQTLLNDSGPRHVLQTNLVTSLRLGDELDAELDGRPNVNADGDDNAGVPDDEDGVTFLTPFVVGQSANMQVEVANAPTGARLNAFFDWNNDGDFSDLNETITEIAVVNGLNNLPPLNVPNGTVVNTELGARFRLSTTGGLAALGRAADGEVEDYLVRATGYDYGDLPDTGVGTGPDNYETLLANNGPRHFMTNTLSLGVNTDAEANGQPDAAALGDDFAGGSVNDEDGVLLANLIKMPRGQSQEVTNVVFNNTGGNATLWGWIDFNANGVVNAGETQTNTVPSNPLAQNVNLTFLVPADAAISTYARFRLGTVDTEVTVPTGTAIDGEVEDYIVTIESIDLGDLPDPTGGAGEGDYQTLLANDGASHDILPTLHLGNVVDADTNGLSTLLADGDDLNWMDDEDGVLATNLLNMPRGGTQEVVMAVFNNTGGNATLWSWLDFNTNAVAEAGETQTNTVPSGNFMQTLTNIFSVPVNAASATYARFRLGTDDLEVTRTDGRARDGEVEDYRVTTSLYDFGDLNDLTSGTTTNDYQTVLTNNGPRHVLNGASVNSGLLLGTVVDAELDGLPNANGTGDDLLGSPNDEDGVVIPVLQAGTTANFSVQVTNAPSGAQLNAFIDWNGNGNFSDDAPITELFVTNGWNNLPVTVPSNAVFTVNLGARFRLSTSGGLWAEGWAADGEVEDYLLPYVRPLVLIGSAWLDAGGFFHIQWNTVPGVSYEIQTSPDLVLWTTVETRVATGFSEIYISPNPVSNGPHEFYRLRQLP